MPANDRRVVRRSDDPLVRLPDSPLASFNDGAAEADLEGGFRPFELPGMPAAQPGLRFLDLASVDETLAEQTVLVTDPVAVGRAGDSGQGIEETRRKPTEAAIAERRIRLVCENGFK